MTTETMESRLVELLKRGWVTPQDALRAVGCFSLAQRVSELKREKEMPIEDKWIDLGGGRRCKAYRVPA